MQFLSLYTPSTRGEPTPEHMDAMGALIGRMMGSGKLIATGALGMRQTGGLRISLEKGDFKVTENPGGESVLLGASGFAILHSGSKDSFIAEMKEFLEIAGDGSCEVIELAMEPMIAPPRIDPAGVIPGVVPYLIFDNANEAIVFYEAAFGAEVLAKIAMPDDQGRVMHCHLKLNGGSLMLGDKAPQMGELPAQRLGTMMQLVLADGQAAWDRAIAAGCTVRFPFNLAPWGDRYGQMIDPFGIIWAINQPAAAAG